MEKNEEKVNFEHEIKEELYFVHFKLFRAAIMEDVIGGNEIHSKIFYCEFYILICSIVTMILSIIDVRFMYYCFEIV